jgi:hypothetical protein
VFQEAVHKPEEAPAGAAAASEKPYDLCILAIFCKMHLSFVASVSHSIRITYVNFFVFD